MNEWMNEWMNERMNEWMNEWMTCHTSCSSCVNVSACVIMCWFTHSVLLNVRVNIRWTTARKSTSTATLPPRRSMLSNIPPPSSVLLVQPAAAATEHWGKTLSLVRAMSSECLDSTPNLGFRPWQNTHTNSHSDGWSRQKWWNKFSMKKYSDTDDDHGID